MKYGTFLLDAKFNLRNYYYKYNQLIIAAVVVFCAGLAVGLLLGVPLVGRRWLLAFWVDWVLAVIKANVFAKVFFSLLSLYLFSIILMLIFALTRFAALLGIVLVLAKGVVFGVVIHSVFSLLGGLFAFLACVFLLIAFLYLILLILACVIVILEQQQIQPNRLCMVDILALARVYGVFAIVSIAVSLTLSVVFCILLNPFIF